MKQPVSLLNVREFAPADFRRWVLGGIALTLCGYIAIAIILTSMYGVTMSVTPRLVTVIVLSAFALWLAARAHEVAGSILAVSAAWLEVETAFATSLEPVGAGILALPALVLGLGLLLGTRAAFWATVVTVVTTIVLHRLSPALRATGFRPADINWFAMHAITMFSSWVLLALSLNGFSRVFDALRSKEQDLADTIRFAPDGILVLDGDGRVLLSNPAASRVLGVEPDQLAGRLIADVLAAVVGDPSMEAVLPADTGEAPIALHLTMRDGRSVDVDATWRRMGGDRRQLLLRDVSDRVRAEEQRRVLEEQQAQSHRLEAVSQLAGGLSHDFNNILTAVSGSAELLREEGEPAARALLLDEIVAARDRGAALTRKLLAFARREVVQPRVIDLSQHVASLEQRLQRVAGDQVRLTFDLAPDCRVQVDPAQVEQALVNLVANARDAMPAGGQCTIAVARLPVPTTAPPVQLRVTDEGAGMPDDVAARAFEPFFTTKGRGQGTGLGLATVHGMAAQAGGTARISTRPGRGTSVTIELPFVAAPVPVALTRAPAPSASASTITILIAEDDAGTRSTVARILKRAGYQVVVAEDGAEAWRLVEAGTAFNLLLSDVMMPGLNGPALAARVRERHPKMPVLFMTGYAEADVGDLGAVAGSKDLITKPFSSNELTARLERLLSASA